MFARENRYLVVKHKDMDCLTELEKNFLFELAHKVNLGRVHSGKSYLMCLVVEHDWPEYELTWEAIKHRT